MDLEDDFEVHFEADYEVEYQVNNTWPALPLSHLNIFQQLLDSVITKRTPLASVSVVSNISKISNFKFQKLKIKKIKN